MIRGGKAQPLAGLRVLDFAHLLPGELATLWLGQLGATVVKVERPGSTSLMGIGKDHPYRAALNRGKKSIVLDLKRDRDRQVARRLVAWADVLVEGYRPGVMARFGLGYQQARAINPRLVYCSISGFGQEGPDRLRPGHDNVYTALAGLLAETHAHGETPHLLPVQLADVGGGTFPALVGILSALWAREHTGEGTYVDVAMLEGTLAWAYLLLPFLKADPATSLWIAGLAGNVPCYSVYETADGQYLVLGALEPHFWGAFCRAVQRPDLRGAAYDPTRLAEVRALMRRHTLVEWLGEDGHGGILNPQEIPVAPVRSLTQVVQDPELRARGTIVADAHGLLHPALPIHFDGARPPAPAEAPDPGEHRDWVLELTD